MDAGRPVRYREWTSFEASLINTSWLDSKHAGILDRIDYVPLEIVASGFT